MNRPHKFTLLEIVNQLFGHEPNSEIASVEESECMKFFFNHCLLSYSNYGLRAWYKGRSNEGDDGYEHFSVLVWRPGDHDFNHNTEWGEKIDLASRTVLVNRNDWFDFLEFEPFKKEFEQSGKLIKDLQEDKPEYEVYDINTDEPMLIKQNSPEHKKFLAAVQKERKERKQLIQEALKQVNSIKDQYKENPFWGLRESKYQHSNKLSLYRITEELEKDKAFAQKADEILKAERPDSTHTEASSVSELLNHWITETFDLPIEYMGKKLEGKEALGHFSHPVPEEPDIGANLDYFEDSTYIYKADFEALLERKGLKLPLFWFVGDNDKERFTVPLRKVPRMTGWAVDELVKLLTGNSIYWGKPILTAYEHRNNEPPIEILPRDITQIEREIGDLQDKYKALETRDGGQEHYRDWRLESLKKIPASWFVWSDELEKAHRKSFHEEHLHTNNEKMGDRELVWKPPLLEDAELVKECYGFALPEPLHGITFKDNQKKSNNSNSNVSTEKDQQTFKFPTPPGASWVDISIRFQDGHNVSVRAKTERLILNYAQIGMTDGRNANPTKQWRLLKLFAEDQGILRRNISEIRDVKKAKERLANHMKVFFGISDDPFEYLKNERTWKAKFSISEQE